MASSDVETVERIIPAEASKIFDLIADPARHHEIDGSGTVRDTTTGSQRLQLGSKFGMKMKAGLPYSMVSTVVEFDEDRRLAWQTTTPLPILGSLVGGRIWRYELEPVEGGTRVRESWDITHEKVKAVVRPMRGSTRKAMEKTLERIEQIVTR
ncbi:MAG: SRPBCC family protein [Actinobacteria bacterium]|nr:SRPBCC family protein [Actinomycetota bacterium]